MGEMDSYWRGCCICIFYTGFNFSNAELHIRICSLLEGRNEVRGGTSRSQPRERDAIVGWGPR